MKNFIATVAFATLVAASPALALDGSEPGDSARLERQELTIAQSAHVPGARANVSTSLRNSAAPAVRGSASSDAIVNSLTSAESDYQ